MGFPGSSAGKEFTCSAGDPSCLPGSGRSAGEGIGYPLQYSWASLVAQLVMNLPAMWETWVWSLGWEDLLENGKATHFSILPREFHGLYKGCKELDMSEWLSLIPRLSNSLLIFLGTVYKKTMSWLWSLDLFWCAKWWKYILPLPNCSFYLEAKGTSGGSAVKKKSMC